MAEDKPDFEAVLDGLYKPTADDHLKFLKADFERERDAFRKLLSESESRRSDLAKRVKDNERLTNWMLQMLLLVGGFYGASKLVSFWKSGDWWGVLTVAACVLIVWLSLRETLPGRK